MDKKKSTSASIDSTERDFHATKELLLRQYEVYVKSSLIATYFGRAAQIVLIFLISFLEIKSVLVCYVLFSASILIGLMWFLESWTAERNKQQFSMYIGRMEEGRYLREWEDFHIRMDYYSIYLIVARFKRYVLWIEPLLWLAIVVGLIQYKLMFLEATSRQLLS